MQNSLMLAHVATSTKDDEVIGTKQQICGARWIRIFKVVNTKIALFRHCAAVLAFWVRLHPGCCKSFPSETLSPQIYIQPFYWIRIFSFFACAMTKSGTLQRTEARVHCLDEVVLHFERLAANLALKDMYRRFAAILVKAGRRTERSLWVFHTTNVSLELLAARCAGPLMPLWVAPVSARVRAERLLGILYAAQRALERLAARCTYPCSLLSEPTCERAKELIFVVGFERFITGMTSERVHMILHLLNASWIYPTEIHFIEQQQRVQQARNAGESL
jgi:hypothetical protein